MLIYKIHQHNIYQFKNHGHKIYQFKIHQQILSSLKTSKWKKVTYLLIYENYDENVGFTKLIKVLKPRIFLIVAFK